MFFRVENLGPLREAEVDLSKRMILLTGPNSTGKTYVAWSIYGFYRGRSTPGATPGVFRALAEEILASPEQQVPFERFAALWPTYLDAIALNLTRKLHLCFAAERKHFESTRIAVRANGDLPASRIRRLYSLLSVFIWRVDIGDPLQVKLHGRHPSVETPDQDVLPFSRLPSGAEAKVVNDLEGTLAEVAAAIGLSRCTLLPTERTAIDMFATELSMRRSELISKAVEAELDGNAEKASISRSVGRYPWPIQDSLQATNELPYLARSESEFADLASELERVLGGGMSVTQEGGVGFTPSGQASPLGIHLTSSIVKSLARLVFFLRHEAEEGDLLMIDEPELNLHPDNQRKVARVLAKAVNRGLKIIMSTHSDYLLRELNNLILLGRDTAPVKEIRDKHGYTESELLSPDKLGVYLFRDGTAESVDVTEDGFEVKSIEDEINRMNAVSQDIYAALHE